MDYPPDRDDGENQVREEAADAGKVGCPAGGGSRRAGGLHPVAEVAVTSRAALLRHPLAMAGVLIATASGVVFVVLLVALGAGLFNNPYAGLVVGIAVPGMLVLGLLLIPAGVWLQRRTRDEQSTDWPVLDFRLARVRRTTLAIASLTAVNVVIILIGGYSGLHWMESPSFCGQACHTPM